MNKRTALYQKHIDAGGRMVDFAGWDMPLNYGSQIAEHKHVRTHAGVFDVSHMTIVDVTGTEACPYLRHLLANDVARLESPGHALYTAMLNDTGGVIDDLIVYRLHDCYRLVVNCATREKDLQWMQQQVAGFEVALRERPELAIVAVSGPAALGVVCDLLPADQAQQVQALGNFQSVACGDWFFARTGYTGEKGLEIMMPQAEAPLFWDRLLAAGVKPAGLGARDTLRLEAGMNLYGHDMDEDTSPLSANMEQTIAWQPDSRDFIGRAAVSQHAAMQQAGKIPRQTGLVLETRGVLREGQKLLTDRGEGVITSGSFSPSLDLSIALARVPYGSAVCQVELRSGLTPVRMIKPGFVRHGKKVFD